MSENRMGVFFDSHSICLLDVSDADWQRALSVFVCKLRDVGVGYQ